MGTRGRDGQYGVLQERAMCTTSPSKLIIILIHQVEDAVLKQNQPAQWATCTGGSESAEVAAAHGCAPQMRMVMNINENRKIGPCGKTRVTEAAAAQCRVASDLQWRYRRYVGLCAQLVTVNSPCQCSRPPAAGCFRQLGPSPTASGVRSALPPAPAAPFKLGLVPHEQLT
jgi:hypothetical protein